MPPSHKPDGTVISVDIAHHLKLDYEKMDGTLEYLCRLLSGPWDSEDFVIIPPHTSISQKQFDVYS